MIKYRTERVNKVNKSQTQSNEEKNNSNNNKTSSTNSNPPSSSSYISRSYKRINRAENDPKIKNFNDINKISEVSTKKNDNVNANKKRIRRFRKEDSNKENENPNLNNNNRKKSEILEKLKKIVPIIEDKEGEENITPSRQGESCITERDNHTLCNNMFINQFQNKDNDNNDNQIKSARNSNTLSDNYKNKYNNVLIDTILDVEKFNVNKYLSKDLANIYNEIDRDNIMFKNDIFLGNIVNFERKTGDLDKKIVRKVYKEKKDNKKEYKNISNTNDIINKFFEKTKTFH